MPMLMSKNRPVRTVHRSDGWTPQKIHEHGMHAFKPHFLANDRSADYFVWDPV